MRLSGILVSKSLATARRPEKLEGQEGDRSSALRGQRPGGMGHATFHGPSVGRSREQRWGLLIGYRMCAMRLVH